MSSESSNTLFTNFKESIGPEGRKIIEQICNYDAQCETIIDMLLQANKHFKISMNFSDLLTNVKHNLVCAIITDLVDNMLDLENTLSYKLNPGSARAYLSKYLTYIPGFTPDIATLSENPKDCIMWEIKTSMIFTGEEMRSKYEDLIPQWEQSGILPIFISTVMNDTETLNALEKLEKELTVVGVGGKTIIAQSKDVSLDLIPRLSETMSLFSSLHEKAKLVEGSTVALGFPHEEDLTDLEEEWETIMWDTVKKDAILEMDKSKVLAEIEKIALTTTAVENPIHNMQSHSRILAQGFAKLPETDKCQLPISPYCVPFRTIPAKVIDLEDDNRGSMFTLTADVINKVLNTTPLIGSTKKDYHFKELLKTLKFFCSGDTKSAVYVKNRNSTTVVKEVTDNFLQIQMRTKSEDGKVRIDKMHPQPKYRKADYGFFCGLGNKALLPEYEFEDHLEYDPKGVRPSTELREMYNKIAVGLEDYDFCNVITEKLVETPMYTEAEEKQKQEALTIAASTGHTTLNKVAFLTTGIHQIVGEKKMASPNYPRMKPVVIEHKGGLGCWAVVMTLPCHATKPTDKIPYLVIYKSTKQEGHICYPIDDYYFCVNCMSRPFEIIDHTCNIANLVAEPILKCAMADDDYKKSYDFSKMILHSQFEVKFNNRYDYYGIWGLQVLMSNVCPKADAEYLIDITQKLYPVMVNHMLNGTVCRVLDSSLIETIKWGSDPFTNLDTVNSLIAFVEGDDKFRLIRSDGDDNSDMDEDDL